MAGQALRGMIRTLAILLAVLALTVSAARAQQNDPQQDAVFPIPELNAGLPATPEDIDRGTPRSAVAGFLRAAERGDWDAAAHLLDLNAIPPEDQQSRGPLLARQLHAVIDRKAVLDWSMLIDRPDAMQMALSNDEPQAGQPRRSLLLKELPLDPVPGAIRLNRVLPQGSDMPVWVFPRQTVADIPELYRAYGPSRVELRLPDSFRSEAFLGLMWWELVGLPLLIALSTGVGMAVSHALRWLWRRVESRLATEILKALTMPLIIVSVTSLVWWVTGGIFVFSGLIDVLLVPVVVAGFVTALLLLIVNVVEAAIDNLIAPGEDVDLSLAEQAEARTLATRLNAFRRIMVVVVFLLGVGLVLSTAGVFEGLGLSVVASAGALTLLLGFAARDMLGNVMASLQIALNQSARIGDRVVYKDELCHVERIHMTYVQLRHWDGTRLIVPIKEFISETFENWSTQHPAMLRVLKFKLDPRADVPALRRAFLAILEDLPTRDLGRELGDTAEAEVNVAGQDVFGIDVWFMVPCADPNTSWEVACEVQERLVTRFAEMERETGSRIFPETAAAGDATA